MSEFFNPDSPIMRFITKIANSIYLNILWFVCCLPVVTIGASTTALFYVTLKMAKNEEGNMTAAFFHSFQEKEFRPRYRKSCFVIIDFVVYFTYNKRKKAQKSSDSSKLGYHLENRIIFYLARMISAQKQTEFFHSDFDNLKKVRSIWICMDNDAAEDSIEEIGFDRKTVFGNKKTHIMQI